MLRLLARRSTLVVLAGAHEEASRGDGDHLRAAVGAIGEEVAGSVLLRLLRDGLAALVRRLARRRRRHRRRSHPRRGISSARRRGW